MGTVKVSQIGVGVIGSADSGLMKWRGWRWKDISDVRESLPRGRKDPSRECSASRVPSDQCLGVQRFQNILPKSRSSSSYR